MRAAAADDERQILEKKIAHLEETDMAVVVSQAQNEIEDMKAKGLDIVPHRKRMVAEDLDTKFKRGSDPLRIVFVCAMWMTGFDVPSGGITERPEYRIPAPISNDPFRTPRACRRAPSSRQRVVAGTTGDRVGKQCGGVHTGHRAGGQ